MDETKPLPQGDLSFETIITQNYLYADKTAYLEKLIDDGLGTWFLASPIGSGKTLTVSTLRSLFSGNSELFKGLAIKKNLGEKISRLGRSSI
jgi:hypothetical protein